MSAARSIFALGVAAGISALLIRLASEPRSTVRRIPASRNDNFTDLNDADRQELEKLRLDDLAIDRIINNRPYRHKLELLSRMIIPEMLYKEIRHKVGVRQRRPRLHGHPRAA